MVSFLQLFLNVGKREFMNKFPLCHLKTIQRQMRDTKKTWK